MRSERHRFQNMLNAEKLALALGEMQLLTVN